jgi:hypothetical protein
MKSVALFFLSFLIAYSLFSCECQTGETSGDYNFQVSNGFHGTILYKRTRKPVLFIGQVKYNYDTVAIFNEDWKVKGAGQINNDGSIYLFFIEDSDYGILDTQIQRRYYMYFNYQDIDTIDIAFEAKMNECDEQIIKYFKVAYNDSVYFDAPTERVPYLEFLKDLDNRFSKPLMNI